MTKIYIAGPYSGGDVAQNVRIAILAAHRLSQAGCIPYVPHLSHFWHLLCPRDVEFWYEQGLQWVEACDVLLRLPGESVGADLEVQRARELGMTIYWSVEAILRELRRSPGEATE